MDWIEQHRALHTALQQRFGETIVAFDIHRDELVIELLAEKLHETCLALRDEAPFKFEQLMDVCGVDYLHYGRSMWRTEHSTHTGFSRSVDIGFQEQMVPWNKPRFASVYHLLSVTHNHRLRIKVFLDDEMPQVDSVIDLWPSADWYERESFDLYGILYKGHPDLRRLLTDYGFVGHPFRKDFPLIGTVEMRYDATLGRCVYEPVSIEPRTLVPKVIRQDNRYLYPEK